MNKNESVFEKIAASPNVFSNKLDIPDSYGKPENNIMSFDTRNMENENLFKAEQKDINPSEKLCKENPDKNTISKEGIPD